MLDPKPLIQSLIIILAFVGAYFVADIVYSARKGRNGNLLRARAFLNDSFLGDNWKLLSVVSFIFLINATVELNDIFGILKDVNLEFMHDITVLGLLGCTVLSQYKWLRLMKR
ncbi:MAG: hypothetical protein FIB08_12315 [Candidatus Methanoperedens sp.]|nr:hypothetical protein [Candidatus Methanoperedens sp.]